MVRTRLTLACALVHNVALGGVAEERALCLSLGCVVVLEGAWLAHPIDLFGADGTVFAPIQVVVVVLAGRTQIWCHGWRDGWCW